MKLSRCAGYVVALSGLVVFGSWQDPDSIAALGGRGDGMQPLTALLFVLAGCILAMLSHKREVRYRDEWGSSVSALLIVFGILAGSDAAQGSSWVTFVSHFPASSAKLAQQPDNVVSLFTLLAFAMFGVWGFVSSGPNAPRWKRDLPAGVVLIIGGIAVSGYAFRLPSARYDFPGWTGPMALLTAAMFCILAGGALAVNRDQAAEEEL